MIIITDCTKEDLLIKQLQGMQKVFKFNLNTKEEKSANNLPNKTLQEVIEEEKKKPGRPAKAKEESETTE